MAEFDPVLKGVTKKEFIRVPHQSIVTWMLSVITAWFTNAVRTPTDSSWLMESDSGVSPNHSLHTFNTEYDHPPLQSQTELDRQFGEKIALLCFLDQLQYTESDLLSPILLQQYMAAYNALKLSG